MQTAATLSAVDSGVPGGTFLDETTGTPLEQTLVHAARMQQSALNADLAGSSEILSA